MSFKMQTKVASGFVSTIQRKDNGHFETLVFPNGGSMLEEIGSTNLTKAEALELHDKFVKEFKHKIIVVSEC